MKIYAKQVSPEYQESPLFLDECFPEDIILTGNRNYTSRTTPEYDKIAADFDSMARTWEDIQAALQELLRRFVEEVTQK